VAFLPYSSGTTGLPKGVMTSNAAFFGFAPLLAELWELGPDSVLLIALPLFHMGASGWATIAMTRGGATVLARDPDPAVLADLLPRHQVTHTVLVPSVIQQLLEVPGVEAADFASLQVMGYGASPISETVLARAIDTFGCKFWQGYGLTETTGPATMLGPDDHVPHGPGSHRLRSCGVLVPGYELRIVDPHTGADVPPGDVGEIWVRSRYLMKGYWNRPEETARSTAPGGWFRTGDAGYFDDDGYLYLHDRIKDMIVSGGENVFPAEVENALMAHPAVADAAVIGVPHERWGETPKAVVVLRPGAAASADELAAFCRQRLAAFKCPTSVDFVASLPRNPTGKVLKTELRAPFWEGRDRFVS
jgi:long-chain acyl-CoA synthetase